MEVPHLVVSVPPSPTARDEQVSARLARNVARLFGVDYEDNEIQATFAGAYTEVTREDLRYGFPTGSGDGLAAVNQFAAKGIKRISTSTLNQPQYGPDKKAGAVLAGANTLFDTLLPTVTRVLEVATLREDGGRVAPIVSTMLWTSLAEQAFLGQPAVFVAAIQARQAQRAYLTLWKPLIPLAITGVTAHEYGRDVDKEPADYGASRPRFALLDDSAELALGRDDEDRPHQYRNMADDVVNRWCYHQFGGPEGTVAYVRANGNYRYLEAFAPAERTSALLQELYTALAPQLIDKNGDTRAVTPSDPAWNDPASGLYELLLPRVPTPVDLAQLGVDGQVSLFWTLAQCYENLHNAPFADHSQLRARMREKAIATLELALQTVSSDHPTYKVLEGRLLIHRTRHAQLTPNAGSSRYREADSCLAFLKAANRSDAATTDSDMGLCYLMPDLSLVLNRHFAVMVRDGKRSEAEHIREAVKEGWRITAKRLGIPLGAKLSRGEAEPVNHTLASWLHNYAAFLGSDDNSVDDLKEAAGLLKKIIIPARNDLARFRRQERSRRLSLAVFLRVTEKLTRHNCPDSIDIEHARWYLDLRFVSRVANLSPNPIDPSLATYLAALGCLRAGVILNRAGTSPNARESETIKGAHKHAWVYYNTPERDAISDADDEALQDLSDELRERGLL